MEALTPRYLHSLENRIEYRQRLYAELEEQLANPRLNENQRQHRRRKKQRLQGEIAQLQTQQSRIKKKPHLPVDLAEPEQSRPEQPHSGNREPGLTLRLEFVCPECGHPHVCELKPDLEHFAE